MGELRWLDRVQRWAEARCGGDAAQAQELTAAIRATEWWETARGQYLCDASDRTIDNLLNAAAEEVQRQSGAAGKAE